MCNILLSYLRADLLSHCIKVHREKMSADVFVAIVQGTPTGCSNVRAHNIK